MYDYFYIFFFFFCRINELERDKQRKSKYLVLLKYDTYKTGFSYLIKERKMYFGRNGSERDK